MDKICVVTGGTRGLGFEIVKKLVKDGHKVCVISKSTNDNFEDLLNGNKKKILFFKANIVDEDSINKIANEVVSKYDIEVLINNAGVIRVGDFRNIKYNDVKAVMDANIVGTMLVTKAFLPKIKEQNAGKIVIINSSAGLLGKPMESIYCAAKFAQHGYILALKEELKKTRIKVLGCYPGGMNTSFYDSIRDYAPKEVTNKFMRPDQVAKVICENIYAAESLNISEIIIERI